MDHDPGMNVAYWNLKHREVTEQNGAYFVGSSRLVFFHFSGLGLNGLSILSRHEDRFESLGLPKTIDRLKKNYLEMLKQNGSEFYSRQPYNFDHFTDSSVKIPKAVRELYRTNRSVRACLVQIHLICLETLGSRKRTIRKFTGRKTRSPYCANPYTNLDRTCRLPSPIVLRITVLIYANGF